MRLIKSAFIPYLVLALCVPLSAREKPLASPELIKALTQEVSGEIAYQYTVLLSHYDRIQASRGWHAAAEMIQVELKKSGYTEVELEGWPSNGSRYYFTYQTPIGWDASHAELWMVSPQKERLCSFAEIPLTLVKHSHSADVEAELVDVGTGVGEESYRGKDVTGKIVLATAYTGQVMREAVVERGALGVVTWFPPEERPGYPNMIRYTALWPRWEEREQMGFGFNVSKLQGWRLKKLVDSGERVVLHARVEAEYYDSRIEVVSAALPGSVEPEREVLIVGHLCHPTPSANDNASGSGGMLEMARALKRMIDLGLLERPRRTIRFLWVPEFYGTVPYVKAYLERTRNTLSVINCDMIGEDLHLTGGLFTITGTPDSIPSYLNDVVVDFAHLVQSLDLRSLNGTRHPFAFRVNPYSGGSDHVVFNDGALKVPAVMFGHGDTFHHTSLDTPDKVDASELRRVCAIALGATYYLAHASDPEAVRMSHLITRNGLGRLAAVAYDAFQTIDEAHTPDDLRAAYSQAENVLQHAARREIQAVLSTHVFAADPASRDDIQSQTAPIEALRAALEEEMHLRHRSACDRMDMQPQPPSLSPKEAELIRLVPVRSEDFVCPLQTGYLSDKLGEAALQNLSLRGNVAYEALNFVDGKRSVTAISRAVAAEYGPLSVQAVYDFFKLLERADLIRLVNH
jgi:hypothetical protein